MLMNLARLSYILPKRTFCTSAKSITGQQSTKVTSQFNKQDKKFTQIQKVSLAEKHQLQKQIVNRQNNLLSINFQTFQGKIPLIMSEPTHIQVLPWGIAAYALTCFDFYYIFNFGIPSYLTLGIAAIATYISWKKLIDQLYKNKAPQILTIWKTPTNQYEIQYIEYGFVKKIIVEKKDFIYNAKHNFKQTPLNWGKLGQFPEFTLLNKYKFETSKNIDFRIWCLVKGQLLYVSPFAKINNHHFHSLL